MKILIIGGTRFFGIHMVHELLQKGHQVTIATRGKSQDDFGSRVERIILERTDPDSMRNALADKRNTIDDGIRAVNACSAGTISLKEILDYVEKKTGIAAALSDTGEAAPYNGEVEYSINTKKAEKLGFQFSNLHDWIYDLLDYYIDDIMP
ncbi:MAG: NAD-dependent epimerase/dehydratase family protein [Clostridium sp.]|nr:NAD-dependent epimerase/dehydratase family protein [Clostridium sp.]